MKSEEHSDFRRKESRTLLKESEAIAAISWQLVLDDERCSSRRIGFPGASTVRHPSTSTTPVRVFFATPIRP